jgi:RNA polymerase sigma-70 factor (ECF subfamily)
MNFRRNEWRAVFGVPGASQRGQRKPSKVLKATFKTAGRAVRCHGSAQREDRSMTYDAATLPRDVLADLFSRYHAMLVRFLIRKTHCPQRAEDVAQAAWLKLLSALSRGLCGTRSAAELRAYVFEVAHNTWLDEYTRKHGEVRTRSFDPVDLERFCEGDGTGTGPEEELQRRQVDGLLRLAVTALPAEQQHVIRMWSQGTSIREMSRASAAPRDTVLSRKKYALARMRGALAGAAL